MEQTTKNPLENPFFQLLCRVGDLMIVNLLFLLCSLPVVTLGAAAAALHKVAQDIVLEQESGVVKTFFKAFRENFKQATILWMGLLLIVAAGLAYKLLIAAFCTGTLATAFSWVLTILGLLVLAVAVYLMPMLVRYENTLPELLKNSAILAVIKLPRTLAMMGLALIMPAVFKLSVTVFINTLFFWFIIGFAMVAYMDNVLLRPVFKEMERPTDGSPNMGLFN